MIVRISGEDQYRLPDGDSQRLNELEGAVVAAAEAGNEDSFEEAFRALLDYVRSGGTPDTSRSLCSYWSVPPTVLAPSSEKTNILPI